jgi:hypothetical protein
MKGFILIGVCAENLKYIIKHIFFIHTLASYLNIFFINVVAPAHMTFWLRPLLL